MRQVMKTMMFRLQSSAVMTWRTAWNEDSMKRERGLDRFKQILQRWQHHETAACFHAMH